MYKRLELHNHTTESDSSITPGELIDYMYSDHVDAFAITDHNTISGHEKIRKSLSNKKLPIQAIYGMEFTTYYGHILCLNLNEYLSWENINLHKPELLFHAAKEKEALVGVAHPFSFGNPFSRGCRFDMTISDFTSFDFIEIFNDPEPLHEVNEPALLWWEDLVLSGFPIAATSGMDLHGKWNMANQFATYIEGSIDGVIAEELSHAIHTQKTWLSKGPILTSTINHTNKTIIFDIVDVKKPGYCYAAGDTYHLLLRTKKGTQCKLFSQKAPIVISFHELENEKIIIPKLYLNNISLEQLVAIAPVIYL